MNVTKLVGVLAVLLAVAVLSTGRARSSAGRPPIGAPPDTGRQPDRRAAIFVRRGCAACHAISALGVTAARDVGPDLTFAYADVVNRYGVNLESFLYNPTGVMRLMLASHLNLSRVDRDSMLQILKGLYIERRADMDRDIPSLPPGRLQPRAAHAHPSGGSAPGPGAPPSTER